jgi:3-methyladenine DNA glycosylase AlkD
MSCVDISERLREIKQSFRLMMNGVASQSMREKGLDYKLNWGAPFTSLKEKAEEIGKDYDLSIALWKEDIRECKILATLIMPSDRILPDVVDIWMEQTHSLEIAEMASFNLYQYLPYASEKAFQWMASSQEIPQVCAYHVLSRLFMRMMAPNERSDNEYLDQVQTALKSEYFSVRKAAFASLNKYMDLGQEYEERGRKVLILNSND